MLFNSFRALDAGQNEPGGYFSGITSVTPRNTAGMTCNNVDTRVCFLKMLDDCNLQYILILIIRLHTKIYRCNVGPVGGVCN